MSQYWQKKPLLIRHACPGIEDRLSRDRLIALACGDEVESRLVIRERGHFSLATGPFSRSTFRRLPTSGWTLLVQGVNRVDAAVDTLLRRFAFVPYARLDDVMVAASERMLIRTTSFCCKEAAGADGVTASKRI